MSWTGSSSEPSSDEGETATETEEEGGEEQSQKTHQEEQSLKTQQLEQPLKTEREEQPLKTEREEQPLRSQQVEQPLKMQQVEQAQQLQPVSSQAASCSREDGTLTLKMKKPRRNRCQVCRKRVGLTGVQCRCEGLFCAVHRYSNEHGCTFDYRALGAQEIRRNNPVIIAEKIAKI